MANEAFAVAKRRAIGIKAAAGEVMRGYGVRTDTKTGEKLCAQILSDLGRRGGKARKSQLQQLSLPFGKPGAECALAPPAEMPRASSMEPVVRGAPKRYAWQSRRDCGDGLED